MGLGHALCKLQDRARKSLRAVSVLGSGLGPGPSAPGCLSLPCCVAPRLVLTVCLSPSHAGARGREKMLVAPSVSLQASVFPSAPSWVLAAASLFLFSPSYFLGLHSDLGEAGLLAAAYHLATFPEVSKDWCIAFRSRR